MRILPALLHLAQFWDGRAADVEEQAKGWFSTRSRWR